MMARKTLTFVVNPEQDADIVVWWQAQANHSQAARDAIRYFMRSAEHTDEQIAGAAPLAGFGTRNCGEDYLLKLRQVLREELARVTIKADTDFISKSTEDVDAEAAARLDAMF